MKILRPSRDNAGQRFRVLSTYRAVEAERFGEHYPQRPYHSIAHYDIFRAS